MMLKVLVYCCCTGTFSSRRIARAIEDSVPVRFLAAGQEPDHRTICRFREQHLDAFEALFGQVDRIAAEAGLVTLGTLAIDGTKIRASASKRKAMSHARMKEEEQRIRKEIAAILARATGEDLAEDVEFGPDFRGDELPKELERRESRLRRIVEARRRLEERTKADAKAKAAKARRRKEEDDDPARRPASIRGFWGPRPRRTSRIPTAGSCRREGGVPAVLQRGDRSGLDGEDPRGDGGVSVPVRPGDADAHDRACGAGRRRGRPGRPQGEDGADRRGILLRAEPDPAGEA